MNKNYILFCLLSLFTVWLSSGTLAPYAASYEQPVVIAPCNYLANIDNRHFLATYRFLQGAPAEQWIWSVTLRRILYPLIAYPFMQMTDFYVGGLLTNILLHLATGLVFLSFLSRRYGTGAQTYTALTLATFPGLSYFDGLPYCYNCIIPISLLGFICLTKLYESSHTNRDSIIYGLTIGFLSLGYDLLVYFLPAGVLILACKRNVLGILRFTVCAPIPLLISNYVLQSAYGIPLLNANTASYLIVANSYLTFATTNFSLWHEMLLELPEILIHNFIFSSFIALPVATILLLFLRRIRREGLFSPVEFCFIGSLFIIWLFNNAAPPYPGWQMRGLWIARLYEPIFVALLAFTCRALTNQRGILKNSFLIGILIFQFSVVYGPYLHFDLTADFAYSEFYRHSPHGTFTRHLSQYGRNPFGTCSNN